MGFMNALSMKLNSFVIMDGVFCTRALPKLNNAFQNPVPYGYMHSKLQSTISSSPKLLLSIMHAGAGLLEL